MPMPENEKWRKFSLTVALTSVTILYLWLSPLFPQDQYRSITHEALPPISDAVALDTVAALDPGKHGVTTTD